MLQDYSNNVSQIQHEEDEENGDDLGDGEI
jgi:hypothetical protein